MSLACIYHKTQGMRVVSFAERETLVATGEWFNSPNDAKAVKKPVKKPSKQIEERDSHEKSDDESKIGSDAQL